ncbi:SEC14-like protein 2, partial [Orchesella cincta]
SDKEGKPMVYIKFGEWDVRRSVVTGQLNRARRYIDKMLDDAYRHVVKLQQEGKNATQYSLILDLENYNVVQQGCISCMPLFLYYVQTLQTHFPWTTDKAILVNAPTVFEIAMRLIRPILSQQVRDATLTFGTNKEEYQKFLKTIIEPDQLLQEYGGNLVDDSEINYG